jgi:hypothetical protein
MNTDVVEEATTIYDKQDTIYFTLPFFLPTHLSIYIHHTAASARLHSL